MQHIFSILNTVHSFYICKTLELTLQCFYSRHFPFHQTYVNYVMFSILYVSEHDYGFKENTAWPPAGLIQYKKKIYCTML